MGLKHQQEKRSMDYFAGLDVSVKDTSVWFCLAVIMHRIWVDDTEFRWTRNTAAA